jgi:hypothetical protein
MKKLGLLLAMSGSLMAGDHPLTSLTWFYIKMNGNFLVARGEWEGGGVKAEGMTAKAFSEINCYKDKKVCIEASATSIRRSNAHYETLTADLYYYNIVEWTAEGIKAKDTSPLCAINTLEINFYNRSVVAVSLGKQQAQDRGTSCNGYGTTVTQMVDISSVSAAEAAADCGPLCRSGVGTR